MSHSDRYTSRSFCCPGSFRISPLTICCLRAQQIGNRLKDKWVKYQHVVPFFAVAYVLYFIFDYLGGQPGRRNMAAAAQVTAMLIGILLFIVAFYLRTQLRRRYSIPVSEGPSGTASRRAHWKPAFSCSCIMCFMR